MGWSNLGVLQLGRGELRAARDALQRAVRPAGAAWTPCIHNITQQSQGVSFVYRMVFNLELCIRQPTAPMCNHLPRCPPYCLRDEVALNPGLGEAHLSLGTAQRGLGDLRSAVTQHRDGHRASAVAKTSQ